MHFFCQFGKHLCLPGTANSNFSKYSWISTKWTFILSNDWYSFSKVASLDTRKSQQLFRVGKRNTSLRQVNGSSFFSNLRYYCDTRAYLFSLDEGSCYVFTSETIVASFLHLDSVILQSDHQSRFKTPVCAASLFHFNAITDQCSMFYTEKCVNSSITLLQRHKKALW